VNGLPHNDDPIANFVAPLTTASPVSSIHLAAANVGNFVATALPWWLSWAAPWERPLRHRRSNPRPSAQPGRPLSAMLHADGHIAQLTRYIDDLFGFDQW